MRVTRRSLLLVATLAAVTSAAPVASAAAAQAACAWTPSLLPVPAGVLASEVSAADDSGGHAGTISFGADEENDVVLWKGGALTNFGYLAGRDPTGTFVTDANRSGTVVGSATDLADGLPHGFLGTGGTLTELPVLPKADASDALGINDSGDIVGGVNVVVNGNPKWHAVRWPADAPGTVVELTGLPSGEAVATGIDQDGTVLVEVDRPSGNRHPYLWKDGVATALALPPGGVDVLNRGISNGRVIGQVDFQDGHFGGVLWERDGTPVELPRAADVFAVNEDGLIVGRTTAEENEFGVWQAGALSAVLPYTADTGLELTTASDDGTIAGRSWTFDGSRDRATVWHCG